MKRFARAVSLALLAFGSWQPAQGQVDFAPKVHARLIAERDVVAPGTSVAIALEEDIRPGWHTYWSNPGDAGAPTSIIWTLPKGWHAGPVQWPYPVRQPVGPLVDYGYEGKPWLLSEIHIPADAARGNVVVRAAVNWLVCKEVCVPEETTLTLPMRVAGSEGPVPPARAKAFAAARARIPVPAPWPVHYRLGRRLELFVASPQLAAARPASAEFFPARSGEIRDSASEKLGIADRGIVLSLSPGAKVRTGDAITGVLVLKSSDGSVSALDVRATPGFVPRADFSEAGGLTLALALLFAFAGGLILNLMPCVLPVLAMKALALANHAHGDRSASRREGIAYSLGAVLSFAAFGAAIVTLRAGGDAIGWGFQLQQPVAVAVFALLIFAVGLNLSGVYEVAPVAAGGKIAGRSGVIGSFFTGVLAVAVAAPCTAPFMAAALGFAVSQPALIALAVFIVLGTGFAMPFLLFGFFPALQRLLPKPGLWMLRLKQVLAFPMYGAAAWLVWVLAQQVGAVGVAVVLAAMIGLAFAFWLFDATRPLTARGRAIGSLAALLAAIAALSPLTFLRAAPASGSAPPLSVVSIPSERYTPDRLAALRRSGRPVFVDATAAWCITCLVNEEAVLSRPAVRDAFAAHKVAFLVADWTNRDADVTKLLTEHQRSGVPLYLYYAPSADAAKVLPQILTEREVLKAIDAD